MKLLAIDGNSILNRAFYGIKLLSNKKGVYTNAIFGFMNIYMRNISDVRPDAVAKQTAEREGVDIRLYKVIYQAIEDVEAAMKGMLEPIYEEKVIGHAEVRQIFKASAIGNIAGSFVMDGRITRDSKIRITREGEQIFEGALASLKRFKDDAKEVKEGFECGLVFDGFEHCQRLFVSDAGERAQRRTVRFLVGCFETERGLSG